MNNIAQPQAHMHPAGHDAPASEGYAFDDFLLYLPRRDLLRSGVPVPITPRLFNALLLFVQYPHELLGKDWLMSRLWPGLVVTENSLSQSVAALRNALGCDGRRYIRTEARRGFRFLGEVTRIAVSSGCYSGSLRRTPEE